MAIRTTLSMHFLQAPHCFPELLGLVIRVFREFFYPALGIVLTVLFGALASVSGGKPLRIEEFLSMDRCSR